MRRLLFSLVLALAAGCATSGAFRAGETAERLQDYDRAVLEYQKALKDDPDNVQYRRVF
jgi:predicted TPR repeat methyltransferase